MGTRRSAAALSAGEVERLAAAINTLKEPDPTTGVSIYDRFVALHGAVMRIRVTFASGNFQLTNMAHWNIGFCPWHRQYLREFERELQLVDPDVDIPYWDWDDHPAAVADIFADAFAGSLGPPAAPAVVTTGRFANFEIAGPIVENWGSPLQRGGGATSSWPPAEGSIAWLEDLRFSANGTHPLWTFWQLLEAGWPNILNATHNAAHNLIGGHMSGTFSPNDPIFWLHHANVDRIWANWQGRYLIATDTSHPSDWPPPDELSPLDGNVAPYGHRLDDLMWPWVGDFSASFESQSATPDQLALVRDPASLDEVLIRDVLNINSLGYDYAN